MSLLTAGQPAPDFSLPNQHGNTVKLAKMRGTWVVIYFYPKAMTPGCTTQACKLRDGRQEIEKHGFTVLGISPDSPERLTKFAAQEGLDFTLLGDPDHKVAEAYGTWQQKTNYGKTYMGMTRSTFIVDPQGIIRKVWAKVDPKTHLDNILKWLETNKGA